MLGACGVLSGLWTGCTAKKQTELVAGVSTQVRVPKDLKSVRIDAQSGGIIVFCGVYDVTNGIARLPKTLALQAAHDPKLPVTITVTGYAVGQADANAPTALTSCIGGTQQVKARGQAKPDPTDPNPPAARVLRASRQPYLADKVLFLPMPLRFSCFERDCSTGPNGGPEKTCKAGKCVDPDVDPTTLAEYEDSFIFGDRNTCFSPATCLPDAQPPQVVDTKNCIYALPNTASAPPPGPIPTAPTTGAGLNVRAVYDDGSVSEILDLDKDEGFFLPDPTKPQQFQLADGLCHPDADAAHKVVGLTSSGLCPSKTALQPVCDEESPARGGGSGSDGGSEFTSPDGAVCNPLEIQPAPSALLVLMDRSDGMSAFYSQETAQKVLSLSLSDPAFLNTVIGLEFFPRKDGDIASVCGGSAPFSAFGPSDVRFGEARNVQFSLAAVVKTTTTVPAGAKTQADLALANTGGAYEAVRAFAKRPMSPQFNRLAVLVIGATDYGSQQCGSGDLDSLKAQVAEAFAGGPNVPSIRTYAVNFPSSSNNGTTQGVGAPAADAIALAGGTQHSYNVAMSAQAGPDAFQAVVADLASCVYDGPGNLCHVDTTTGTLLCQGADKNIDPRLSIAYRDPLTTLRHAVGPNVDTTSAGCEGKSGGWNFDVQGRIEICGSDCAALRDVLRVSGEAATVAGITPPAVPLYLTNCGGGSSTGSSTGGGTTDSGTATSSDASPDATVHSDGGSIDGGLKAPDAAFIDDAGVVDAMGIPTDAGPG